MPIDSPSAKPQKRAAFYVDGFNVYHGVASLGEPHLKWLDWWALAESIAVSRGEVLAKVTFCTAPPSFKSEDVQRRHTSYTQALSSRNVKILSGFFIEEDADCRYCHNTWKKPQEKEGDVNLAISLIGDAYADIYDTAYLVSADNDQAPTLRHLRDVFGPSSSKPKSFAVVLPPNRTSRSLTALAGVSGSKNIILLDKPKISAALLPQTLVFTTPAGTTRNVHRPPEYEPPIKVTKKK